MRRPPEGGSVRALGRRDALRLAGSTTLGLLAIASPGGRRLFGAGTAHPQAGPEASCSLAPEQTEGPYHLEGPLLRRNVTERRPGTPLWVTLRVADAATCAAISGAVVEIWHADANGDYSGFNGFEGQRFMRGQQIAGEAGAATFRTVYPGWYRGRTVHIHVKVHAVGSTAHTGQLYFDDALTDAVYLEAPYAARGTRDTRNEDDAIYGNGGPASRLAVVQRGQGYWGSITLAVTVA